MKTHEAMTIPQQIAYIGRVMFEQRLTDITGGNISVRDGDKMYCTPRYAGSKWHWHLTPEDIVVGPVHTDDLLGNPSFTREGISHLAIYRAFPEASTIIHAHPWYVLPFCAAERPIEPVLEAARNFGIIGYIKHAAAYSHEQADNIVESLREKRHLIDISAAAVMIPKHGIFVVGQDLWMTLDSLSRISTNAWCILVQGLLPSNMSSPR